MALHLEWLTEFCHSPSPPVGGTSCRLSTSVRLIVSSSSDPLSSQQHSNQSQEKFISKTATTVELQIPKNIIQKYSTPTPLYRAKSIQSNKPFRAMLLAALNWATREVEGLLAYSAKLQPASENECFDLTIVLMSWQTKIGSSPEKLISAASPYTSC